MTIRLKTESRACLLDGTNLDLLSTMSSQGLRLSEGRETARRSLRNRVQRHRLPGIYDGCFEVLSRAS